MDTFSEQVIEYDTAAVKEHINPCFPKPWRAADNGPRRLVLSAGYELEMLIACNFDLQQSSEKGKLFWYYQSQRFAVVLPDDKLRDIYCTVWSCIAESAFSIIIAIVVKCCLLHALQPFTLSKANFL